MSAIRWASKIPKPFKPARHKGGIIPADPAGLALIDIERTARQKGIGAASVVTCTYRGKGSMRWQIGADYVSRYEALTALRNLTAD